MARGTLPKSYLSSAGDLVLYLTPLFTYEICVYRLSKGLLETLYISTKYSLTPINITANSKYVKRGKDTIITTIDWIGAPKKFLLENKFSEVDIESLKIKKRKKHGKEL